MFEELTAWRSFDLLRVMAIRLKDNDSKPLSAFIFPIHFDLVLLDWMASNVDEAALYKINHVFYC